MLKQVGHGQAVFSLFFFSPFLLILLKNLLQIQLLNKSPVLVASLMCDAISSGWLGEIQIVLLKVYIDSFFQLRLCRVHSDKNRQK